MGREVSLFDQAAEKLRQAMEGAGTGIERMFLIHEALALYHRHQLEEAEQVGSDRGAYAPQAASAEDLLGEA
jgi:hypothetical protein